ncbi:MAG: ATP-binding protein [Acidimicrobiales bacterium]
MPISMVTQQDSASSGGHVSLARIVRALRERVPLTQEELAHRAGLSVGTVRGLESGRVRRPRSASVRILADALGLTDHHRAVLVAAARGEPVAAEQLQLDGPSVDHETGSTDAATVSAPSQLPATITDFTGRDEHVAQLERILATEVVDGPTRPVAISAVAGRGGVGKTTLAVHVAHQVATSFPDGQLYVDLRGAQASPVDPTRALARFLRALGIEESAIPDDLDERAEVFRERIAGRRCLVVLDNAASEAQVRPLLPGAPACAVVVTSRRRLTGLEGAAFVELDIFEPGQAAALLVKIVGADRLRAEPEHVQEIARLCGHLPLAVRIAGARLAARPHWRIAQLVDRLTDERRRLDELTTGDLEVRASIGLSYVSLDDEVRLAFRLVGMLEVATFAPWVVAALLDITVDEATDLLDDLSTARLVEVIGPDPTGTVRYRLHDLIRLYARERAVAEDPQARRDQALARALGAWLALAEHADTHMPSREMFRVAGDAPRWWPGAPTAEAARAEPLAWFETERLGLVAAVGQACALGLDELAWELAASAYPFFDRRGFLDDWEHSHSLALAACRAAGNTRGRAVIARNLACLCEQRGRDRLLPCADEAVAASQELGDGRVEADARIEWGILHRHDDPAAGRASIEHGLALADHEAHNIGSIHGRIWLGVMHRESGDHDLAANAADQCLELARRQGNPGYQIEALRLLGASRREQARYDDSEQAFTQALETARSIGNRTDEARVLTSLGDLYVHWGRPQARQTLEQGLELTADLGDEFGQALALRILGELDTAEGRYDDALASLQTALDLNRKIESAHIEALILRAVGQAHAGRGDTEAARSVWHEARRLFEQLGDSDQAASLAQRLASLERH